MRRRQAEIQDLTNERVRYILNDYNDKEFADILYKKDKESRKLNDEINIYDMIQNVASDLLQKLSEVKLTHYIDRLRYCYHYSKVNNKIPAHDIKGIMYVHETIEKLGFEVYNLIIYVNEQLRLWS